MRTGFYIESTPVSFGTSSDLDDADRDILALLCQGTFNNALGQLVHRHGEAIYRYCLACLKDPSLAEDVRQQVFIEAYENFERFSGRSSLKAWLFQIAHYRILDAEKARRRVQARIADSDFGDVVVDPMPLPDESLDNARSRKRLAAAVKRLAEPVQRAVMLRSQGLSFQQIGALLDEKPGTVQVRVARATNVLRSELTRAVGRR